MAISLNRIRPLLMSAAVAACTVAMTPARVGAQVTISVNIGPPALPAYAQPICPGPGYLWTPGYWAYGPRGYFWRPGAWARPPQPGLLWTPAWWGRDGGHYRFHPGYWGPRVGYYGGVPYGYGYPGAGYEGGEWRGREFFYNADVNHVDEVHMRNFYRHERHFEDRGGEFREHHDNGKHYGWDRHEDRGDNGRHEGWEHGDHGDHGHGHGHEDR